MSLADKLFDRLVLPFLRRREMESLVLRDAFKRRYDIEIGLYSYGCFDRWRVPEGTRIGRYCSFAKTARLISANHPIDHLSTHPFLYDVSFGIVSRSRVQTTPLVVEDDVWIGHNAIVTPRVGRIGRGAIIGSGAVVTKDVPPYAVVAGVPAAIVRHRFDEPRRRALEESRWWLLDKQRLRAFVRDRPDLDPATGQLIERDAGDTRADRRDDWSSRVDTDDGPDHLQRVWEADHVRQAALADLADPPPRRAARQVRLL